MAEEIVSIFIGESQLQLALTVDQVRWSLLTKVIFSSYVCEVKKISAHRLIPNVCNLIKKNVILYLYDLCVYEFKKLYYLVYTMISITESFQQGFYFELINLNK